MGNDVICAPCDEDEDDEEVVVEATHLSATEKKYAHRRCAFVDEEGDRCDRWGIVNRSVDGQYRCIAHGGIRRCIEENCREWAEPHKPFCAAHQGVCKAPGCTNQKHTQAGYCNTHAFQDKYKWALRRERLWGLRDKWLDAILAEQGGRCARSVRTCEVVDDGDATPRCPWGERALPTDAAELDHITPLSEEGEEDERDNLQVLCACCHAMKTHAERRALAAEQRALAAAKREATNRKRLASMAPTLEKAKREREARKREREAREREEEDDERLRKQEARERAQEERALERAEKKRREALATIVARSQGA